MSLELHSSRGHAFQHVMRTKDTKPHECLLCYMMTSPMTWTFLHTESFFHWFVESDPNIEVIDDDHWCCGSTIKDVCRISFIARKAECQVFSMKEFEENMDLQEPVFLLCDDPIDYVNKHGTWEECEHPFN